MTPTLNGSSLLDNQQRSSVYLSSGLGVNLTNNKMGKSFSTQASWLTGWDKTPSASLARDFYKKWVKK